jgi:2-iminoacetate synthase
MFNIPPFSQLQEEIQACTDDDVRLGLRASHPGVAGLAALLSPAADSSLAAMAERAAEITALRFGRTTQIYAPLYLSSFCVNRCSYCGFSADNKIERRLLALDEAEAEAAILLQRGFNHILLVSGEAPAKLGVNYLEKLALRLCDIYQETYDREVYRKVHLGGQKADFDFRLETPARAAAGGMREVGIGALLGLADWRAEGLALGLHLAWLRKKFWRTALTVSFPRLRPAAGEFQPLCPVTERDLSQLIFALRIFDPDVGIILSTREEARYRNGMIGLGPTRFSAGSCTAPGGYSNPDLTGEQFAIGDHRSVNEVCAAIKQKGFDPVRKDWDTGFQR